VALASGTHLGPYEVLAPLGAGGMGEVYRARDPRLNREVAIKVLPEEVSTDPDRLRRFQREARAAGALNHPNILAVYDTGGRDETPFVVTELLEGETLRESMAESRLTVDRAVDFGVQIARGLAAAHEKGIVHRDLKPENLFVTKDGQVKILDFGLAKQHGPAGPAQPSEGEVETVSGTVMGTAGYMSPEQVRGHAADQRSDIFSFGAVLYEMLSGRRAFQGDSGVEVMHAILKEEPAEISKTDWGLPLHLSRIVEIWICDEDGTSFRQLTSLEETLTANGHWSPDGQQIAFMSAKEGSLDAYVVSAMGGIPKRLTTEPWDEIPYGWSNDGRWFYFSSNRTGRHEVWKMPPEGGEAIQITKNGGGQVHESPGGQFLYFGKRFAFGGPLGIWRIPMDGGPEEPVLEHGGFNDWALTQDGICYINRQADPGPAIELVEFATGRVSTVTVLEGRPISRGLSVSPDQRSILYVRLETETDIMLVENIR